MTEVFRQRDPLLIKALGEVRVAELSDETIHLLLSRKAPLEFGAMSVLLSN